GGGPTPLLPRVARRGACEAPRQAERGCGMSLIVKLRRGEGPFWGGMKRLAKRVLHFHIPVVGLTLPLFRGLYLLHVFCRELLSSALRFFWYEPLFRSQCESVGENFQMEQLPYMQGV